MTQDHQQPAPKFTTPPPALQYALISFPTPRVLLATLNRPASLNCINTAGHAELHALWEWFDAEPGLRVAVVTGKGRAFCAGQDLKEWNTKNSSSQQQQQQPQKLATPPSGFAGISRRGGKKPIIAAVNGPCLGGGCELVINADLVLASRRHAYFALPEVKRGVVAIAGGLPRLVRTVGKQRAMEMALTGRNVSAEEAERWGLVNELVDGEADAVVKRAVEVAETIAANSPDAVIVSREGVKMGWEGVGAEDGSRLLIDAWERRLYEGENMKEGVRAFVEKRAPRWVDSKL
ncbi:enoyl-CoA hydratase [Thermoascus aurantiacus ATCC 26904]